jgi:riboflavin synthase
MFTGIITGMGRVLEAQRRGSGCRLVVEAGKLGSRQRVGDSVAINGVCLTVVDRDGSRLTFELGPETLARTNLGDLSPGDPVNLEEALRAGSPLGGHFVQGHVDGVGMVQQRRLDGDFAWVWIAAGPDLTVDMVPKGSVAVDGVSLTLVQVERERFLVQLIPHTLAVTTLGLRKVGDKVNIEVDILAKYVRKAVAVLLGRNGGAS